MVSKFKNVSVESVLPRYRAGRSESIPKELIGATIVAFGSPRPSLGLEGGGLVIDYIPKDERLVKRIVFAFNELGMWVE